MSGKFKKEGRARNKSDAPGDKSVSGYETEPTKTGFQEDCATSNNADKPAFVSRSTLDHALSVAALGYKIFPAKLDKTPFVRDWENAATQDEAQIRKWWRKWPDANIAAAVGASGICVIDVDVKNGKDGINSFQELVARVKVPKTRTVRTPSGGGHIHLSGRTASSIEQLGSGIDIKSVGGYVLMPGSSTAEGEYTWKEQGALQPVPAELISKIGAPKSKPDTLITEPEAGWDNCADVKWAVSYLSSEAEPALEGFSGDNTTFQTACSLRDHGLSEDTAFELMLEHYNPRCEPPWNHDDLKMKVSNAYTYANGIAGAKSIAQDFDDDFPVEWFSTNMLEKGRDGKPRNGFANCLEALKYVQLDITYDVLACRSVVRAEKLPWKTAVGREINEKLVRIIRHFLLEYFGIEFSKENVFEACETLAQQNHFNPVEEYLKSLRWDGVERLDSWLEVYLGAEGDREYLAAIGSLVLIAAVRRTRKPGCKFDNVMILEGKQGSGKSTALSILGGDWYSDAELGRVDNKDAPMILQNTWLHELGELVTLSKSESESIKAFISRSEDRYRAPYDRSTTTHPRRCIFIGTTNSNAYLRDSTGNRRYWPVKTNKIDLDRLERDRDQLWAEAAAKEKSQASLSLPEHLWQIAGAEQDTRRVEHPWFDLLKHWLDSHDLDRVLTQTLLKDCLRLEAGRSNQHHGRTLREVMVQLGWDYKKGIRINSRTGAGYIKKSASNVEPDKNN